jgi:hypothetical protein
MPAAQLPPYSPVLYQPDSYGRYRQYPRQVVAAIPGTGYDVGEMVWAEQELNLKGSAKVPDFGNYERVPLRGLGNSGDGLGLMMLSVEQMRRYAPLIQAAVSTSTSDTGGQGAPGPAETPPEDEAALFAPVPTPMPSAPVEQAPEVPDEGFFSKKVGPVPVWALGVGGVALAGGLGFWFWRRSR